MKQELTHMKQIDNLSNRIKELEFVLSKVNDKKIDLQTLIHESKSNIPKKNKTYDISPNKTNLKMEIE